MKYIKKFNQHINYETYELSRDFIRPNVSYCVLQGDTHYNSEHDYSQDYLTSVALEDGTISFNIWKSMGTEYITSISYSIDNGETWTTTNNTNNKSKHLTIMVNVNKGDKVLWKGYAQQTGYNDVDDYGNYVGSFFSSTSEFNIEGNIMSLLYGDDFKGKDNLEYDGQFARLFSDYNAENECNIVSARDLLLPATTLANYCYVHMFEGCISLTVAPQLLATTLANGCYSCMFYGCENLIAAPKLPVTTLADDCYSGMFHGCESLTIAPVLPATTLANGCYKSMFDNCINLTTAPELPATILANNCYEGMFYNCVSLIKAPTLPAMTLSTACYFNMFRGCASLITVSKLPATILANNCYQSMFTGCSSLTTVPKLPATTLFNNCYYNMFSDCTSLTVAPELPATTLASNCYSGMFVGCTSLVTAPRLPATTLTKSCYYQMFRGCTSLVTAPELPATELTNYCYNMMFYGCTSLNYIKAMFTTTPSTSYTQIWVNNVSTTGTFVKSSTATWNVNGSNGIPNGWTVETVSK